MLCRLIFRKSNGEFLLKTIYTGIAPIPTPEQEIEDFAILNGYNVNALTVLDLTETHEHFKEIVGASNIRLNGEELLYDNIEESPTKPINPVGQVNEKLDLLIQMQLEKEGII